MSDLVTVRTDDAVEDARCEATCSTHGQRCRSAGVSLIEGRWSCRRMDHKIQLSSDAPGHVPHAMALLVEAMTHARWREVPGEIRHLIEYASVELQRASDGGS